MIRLLNIRSLVLGIGLFLMGINPAFCGEELYSTILRGAGIAANNQIVAKDIWYDYMQSNNDWYNYTGGQTDYTKRFANAQATGRASLQYDGSELKMYSTPWELTLSYHVKAYGAGGNLLEEKDDKLTITYDPNYNSSFVDVAVNEYQGAHRLDLKITHISGQPNGVVLLADDFIFEGIIAVERYFILNHNTTILSGETILNNNGSGQNTLIEFLWSYTEGAEEYELQYVYVTDRLIGNMTPDDVLDFSNATRIITPFQDFRLIPAYESGSLFYRVRPLGRHGENFEHTQLGKWSTEKEIVFGETLGSGVDILSYENNQNWISQITHAEFGKRTETSVFVDGAGQIRQTVVKDNSTDLVLIKEDIFDYEGRPAVNILPSPFMPDEMDASNLEVGASLRFYNNFSLAHNTITQFNKAHFDTDANRNNPLGLKGNTAETAGTFASPGNPLQDYGFNRYIASAVKSGLGAFTYSRTIYDDQGRVKERSGVGPDMKIGSGHTTKFYYGTPSQKKLDRLFGTEIGYAEHYRKKMSQDPNGQLSVSYETLGGDLIATALVGYAPTQTLGGNTYPLVDEVTTADGILGITTEDLSNHNEYNAGEREWEIVYSKLVSTPGPYTFQYDLNLTAAQYGINCGSNSFNHPCEYLLDIQLLNPDGDVVNFLGNFNIAVVDVNGNTLSNVSQNSFPVEVVYGNNYTLNFSATFGEVGNYTIVKELRLKGVEDAISAYSDFVNNPANNCASATPIISDCDGPLYNTEDNWVASSGEDCDALLSILKGDMSPGGQYFDNLFLGVSDPATVNNWLKGTGYSGPNILDPLSNGTVTAASFTALKNILTAEGITITIGSVDAGWNAFREYWNIPAVQDHLLLAGNGNWGLYQFHPEYGHYHWCNDMATFASNNANWELNVLQLGTFSTSWATNLQGPCPTGSSFYQIMNADPYFSSAMGTRAVNGNGLNGKQLMRSLICDYPEQPDQNNNMWNAAKKSAQQLNGGSATTQQIGEVFVQFYIQQKHRVMALQKKNPCDATLYSPYLYDAAAGDSPPDMVADLPRNNAVYLWGPSAYDLGGNSSPSSGLPPIYNNWETSCSVLSNSIPKIQSLINNWSTSNDNKQLWVTDQRAEGFLIRVPDMEQATQDIVDGGNNDGIFGQNDDWDEYEDMALDVNPCAQGAAAMIPYETYEIFPQTGINLANGLAKQFFIWDSGASPPACIPISSNPSSCISLITNGDYYSYEDFYYSNLDFFDCLVASINNYISAPWDFTAVHTPDYLIINSPESYLDIPNGTQITTYSNCNCNPAAAPQGQENSFSKNLTKEEMLEGSESGNSTGRASELQQIYGCYPFINPCNQIIPHCLCEDFYGASAQAGSPLSSVIAPYYIAEYGGGSTSAWINFLNSVAYRCNAILYNSNATESQISTAIEQLEDIADGVVDLPTSPNTPAPVPLNCFDLEPDPCEEGQLIADYFTDQAYLDAINGLIADFTINYPNHCLSTTSAPDILKMTYEDREYNFTLYYRSPEGNLYATVPPEGVRPIPDTDQTVFTQINTIRDNGWGSGYIVPKHRRNVYRPDQLMTVNKFDSYGKIIETKTPDYIGFSNEADGWSKYGEMLYLYDDLGRLRFSRSPEQGSKSKVAYFRYDGQGRLEESGELGWATGFILLEQHVNNQSFPDAANYVLSQINKIRYDLVGSGSPGLQENLRKRVVKSEYFETENVLSHATHYSYDIRGNVKTVWQEDKNVINPNGFVKRIDYSFGVVDGLVYQLDYQKGKADAYAHQYCYDQNNRLSRSMTSDGGGIWDQDQRNFYRIDGPAARMELGQYKVQGLDYAYTVQGWIKGVNSGSLKTNRDIGNDGATSTSDNYNKLHRLFAQDAYGYSLYYHTNDYASIESFSLDNQFYTNIPSSNGIYFDAFDGGLVAGLFNGNIAAMQTALTGANGQKMDYVLKGYSYDQLMRLKAARTAMEPAASGIGNQVFTSNYWDSNNDATEDYQVEMDYDRNGNITTLERRGYQASGQSNNMDNFAYNYTNNPIGRVNNRLRYVSDAVAVGNYSVDIDNQGINNYQYDRNGNLISDAAEQIALITWNLQGKVKEIKRTTGSQKPDLEFRYDSQGNRIEKIVKPKSGTGTMLWEEFWKSTFFVRDAQGNVLATYDKDYDRPIVNGSGVVPNLTQYQNDVYAIRSSSGLTPPTDPTGIPELGFTGGSVPPGSTGYDFMELIRWQEAHIYSNARLGVENKQQLTGLAKFRATFASGSNELINVTNLENFDLYEIKATFERELGAKQYELTNHLGNVLEVISDRLIPVSTNGLDVAYFESDIRSASDYYPFGMQMPDRIFNSGEYRYGFGGHEKDDEIKGSGNHLSFGDYGYDPRTGRRWNVDPKFNEIAGISPYSYALDNPIVYIDKDGKLPIIPLLLKAGAAGAADMLAQAAMAYYFDPKVESAGQAFEVVNWWQVSRSAAEGLIPWRTPGGRIGKAAATASGDVLVNALDAGSNYTQEQALKDFATGFIGDLAGGGLGDLVSKYGAKGVANGLLKMGFDTKYIRQATGGLNNKEVRSWYSDQVKKIDINIDPTEANARMVVGQRNSLKQQARDLMSDRKAAADLDISDPIQDFDYYNKKYSGDYSKIMKGGTTPNADVNKKLGVQ